MPPKLANLKPRLVIRALQKAGFYVKQKTGAHVHLKHPAKPGRVTIPITRALISPSQSFEALSGRRD